MSLTIHTMEPSLTLRIDAIKAMDVRHALASVEEKPDAE